MDRVVLADDERDYDKIIQFQHNLLCLKNRLIRQQNDKIAYLQNLIPKKTKKRIS